MIHSEVCLNFNSDIKQSIKITRLVICYIYQLRRKLALFFILFLNILKRAGGGFKEVENNF